MAWRMLARRCPVRSMTVVGDVAQASAPWGGRSWRSALEPVAPGRWRVAELSVNYRTPSEVMAVARDVLAAVDPAATAPSSVRDSGQPPLGHRVADGIDPAALAARTVEVTGQARTAAGDGKVAVITSVRTYAGTVDALRAAYPGEVATGAAGLDAPVAVLQLTEAKGLEFDAVVLVEPEDWLAAGSRGLRDLYVALTRATQRLDVVHTGELPAVLSGLRPA
jgi:superfamily I DNA/RNA helicase